MTFSQKDPNHLIPPPDDSATLSDSPDFDQALLSTSHTKNSILHFTKESELKAEESAGLFSHVTNKMKKTIPDVFNGADEAYLPQKYKNRWYVKEIKEVKDSKDTDENAQSAMLEVVAQEFFRLFIPGHPKTRWIVDDDKKVYVASKEVANSESFEGADILDEWKKRHI